MIQPEELRIGNWLLLNGSPVRVSGINMDEEDEGMPIVTYFDVGDVRPLEYQLISPINITAQILEQCGFKQLERKKNRHVLDDVFAYDLFGLNGTYRAGRWVSDTITYFISEEINYFHHLQNLHFALTGKELKWQPDL